MSDDDLRDIFRSAPAPELRVDPDAVVAGGQGRAARRRRLVGGALSGAAALALVGGLTLTGLPRLGGTSASSAGDAASSATVDAAAGAVSTAAAAPTPAVPFPASGTIGDATVTLTGDASAPTVLLTRPGAEGGAPVTVTLPRPTARTISGSAVLGTAKGGDGAVLVPLGDDGAAVVDRVLARGNRPAAAATPTRLALDGVAYAVERTGSGPPLDDVHAVWRQRADGTWVSPTGEQPRVARFPGIDGAVVSWFPQADRTFLSVGTGARSVATGSAPRDPQVGGPRLGLGELLTDGPDAAYSVVVLPADARDIRGPGEGTSGQVTVAGGVVHLTRVPLAPTDDVYGQVPPPTWTDSAGRHGEGAAVTAIGIRRTVWPAAR